MYRISFCTTCKGRLHHLKETLPKNIEDNSRFSNLEFVILNYASQDGLDHWMKENMSDQIQSGRVVYYEMIEDQENQYEYFNSSHAKNVSHRLASGDIVVNLDADNYTGRGFAEWVNQLPWELNIIAVPTYIDTTRRGITPNPRGVGGRICIGKFDFLKLGGYDETLGDRWGMEDTDFVQRVTNYGLSQMNIPSRFLQAITHDEQERIANLSSRDIKARMAPEGLYALVWRHRGKRVNQGLFGCAIVRKNWTIEFELKPFSSLLDM